MPVGLSVLVRCFQIPDVLRQSLAYFLFKSILILCLLDLFLAFGILGIDLQGVQNAQSSKIESCHRPLYIPLTALAAILLPWKKGRPEGLITGVALACIGSEIYGGKRHGLATQTDCMAS